MFTSRILRCIAFTVLLLQLTSCDDKPRTDEAPHLPRTQMQKILLDINIAEAYSTLVKDSLRKGVGKNYDSLAVFYRHILAHHKVTPKQFMESIAWYKRNPDELDSVYAKLIPVAESISTAPARH